MKVWITGPGHSGTTLMFRYLAPFFGLEGTKSEIHDVTRLCQEIIEHLYRVTGEPRDWMWHKPERSNRPVIPFDVPADLPDLIKHPGLALAWPCLPLPDLVIACHRDPSECAMSWGNGRGERSGGVLHRLEQLIALEAHCVEREVPFQWIEFPREMQPGCPVLNYLLGTVGLPVLTGRIWNPKEVHYSDVESCSTSGPYARKPWLGERPQKTLAPGRADSDGDSSLEF